MVVKSRREEYAEATRAAIVEAATARFATDGFSGTNIESIAALARVTKGAVYHHFSDKAELFEAVFQASEERLLADVVAGAGELDDPWEAVVRGTAIFLDACCEPAFCRISLEEAPVALGWARCKELESGYFLALLTATLSQLQDAGQIEVADVALSARLLLAALDEAGLAIAAAGPDAAEVRVQAERAVLELVAGLRP